MTSFVFLYVGNQEKGKSNIWVKDEIHFLIELNLFIPCLQGGMAEMDSQSLFLAHQQDNKTLCGLYLLGTFWMPDILLTTFVL